MKRFGGFASACVAVALFVLAPLASAQVLQQVPSDALVVIKVNKLKPVSDKIAAMAQKLGVAAFQPALNDPLGAIKEKGKMQAGLDENGEAAFVFLNAPKQGGEPALVVLLPVTDYKAFLGNFAGATTAGDVTTIKMDGNPRFVANWGNYAAVSPQQAMVATKPTAPLVASAITAKELADKDIVAYFNLKSAREKILPEIAKARVSFEKDFERGYRQSMGGGAAPRPRPGAAAPAPAPAANLEAMKYMPVVKAFIGRLFDVADQVVRDADGATWGVSLTNDGIKLTALADFTAASPSAQTVAGFKGTDQSMLAGLPQSKYIFFGGMQMGDTGASQKLIDTFMAPVQKELTALGSDGKLIQDYIAAMKKYLAAAKSTASGMLVPSGALGQDAIFQIVSVNTGDAKAMLAAQQEMVKSQQTISDMFSPAQIRGMMKLNFKPAAKSLDGVELSEFTTTFAQPAGQQSPQMMQMKQMMTWMYGPQGMHGLSGAIGDDKMIAAVCTKDEVVSQLIASAKAGTDVLSPTVAAISNELPKTRVFAGYFALDQLATTAANYAKMFGMPINFQLPQNLPPIGGTVASDGSAVRADIYVPAQLMQSVIAAGIQSYMQMQGGQAPGGPGGL